MFAQGEADKKQTESINEERPRSEDNPEPKKAMLRRTNTIDVKKHEPALPDPSTFRNIILL